MNQAPSLQARIDGLLSRADALREQVGKDIHDQLTANIFTASQAISEAVVRRTDPGGWDLDRLLDRWLTSAWGGFPVMILVLSGVFWMTVAGANFPSAFLSGLLFGEHGLREFFSEFLPGWSCPELLARSGHGWLHLLATHLGFPGWTKGLLIDGAFLCWAWVVAVMLPPMAIFFPLFTFLEDLGFLPRVAFNLDRFFRWVGGHGKQALCMAMGFGCNAAGVISCRIIESPRERLIAILTNTFVPCNGRWPTLILMSSVFIASGMPAGFATAVSMATLVGVTLLGILATALLSLVLSRTLLRGVPSAFVLELPPYRPPQMLRILYRSLIDRTWFVLKRAMLCAAPAGAIIWLAGAIPVGNASLFQALAGWADPLGRLLGMDGVILLAFILALPANEIVVPIIIMGYLNLSRMTELAAPGPLFVQHGWSWLTAVCVMLFSLLHFPCATTTLTIWAETRDLRWTALANLLPTLLAVGVCFVVAQGSRWFGLA